MAKKKWYVVRTLFKGKRKLWAESAEDAWKAALSRGWKPMSITEDTEEKKAA